MSTLSIRGKRLNFIRLGKGAPLVLLHGFPLDHTIWDFILPLLEDRFDVISPDLPGFGGSDSPGPAPTMETYALAVADLLHALNLERVFLAGHSMGGYVALTFARLHPERLSGLALIASQAAADAPERKAGRYQTAEQVAVHGVGVVADAMAPRLSANPEHAPALRELILCQKPETIIDGLRAMAERPDSMPALAHFDLPLLLIHGQADVLIPSDRAREIARLVPHAVLVELTGVGHMPMMEAPQVTAEALMQLLGK